MVNGKISKNKKLILIISVIILVILLFVIIVSLIYYLFIKSNKTEEERVIQDLPAVDLDNKVILINDRFIRYDPGLYTGPQSDPGVVHRGPKLVKVN
jgi:hypothetical protein